MVNKLQQEELSTWDSRTVFTTVDGHTVDNVPKSWQYMEMRQNSTTGSQVRLRTTNISSASVFSSDSIHDHISFNFELNIQLLALTSAQL